MFVLTLLHNPLKIRYLIKLVARNPFQMWLKDFPIQLEPLSTEPRNSVIRGTFHYPPVDMDQPHAPSDHFLKETIVARFAYIYVPHELVPLINQKAVAVCTDAPDLLSQKHDFSPTQVPLKQRQRCRMY